MAGRRRAAGGPERAGAGDRRRPPLVPVPKPFHPHDPRVPEPRYTESIKVPFPARWPGRLPAGTANDRLVATVDIKPTILQAAVIGLQDGDIVDGHSLLDGRRRERLLAEYWQDQANALGIRDWVGPRTGEGCA